MTEEARYQKANYPAEARFDRNPNVLAKQVEDDIVLVHLETNRIYELNPTGAALWELVGAGLDRQNIEQRLLEEFDVDQAQLADEIDDILSRLTAEDLVRVSGDGAD